MACAKPPNPNSMTAPNKLRHPSSVSASALIRELTNTIRKYPPGTKIQRAFEQAEFALEKARKDGASSKEIAQLEQQIRSLKGEAHRDLRKALPPKPFLRGTTAVSKLNVETAIKALESNTHWASKEYRANLIAMIEQNGRIPEAYKEQLHKDVATVLKMCPEAGGLVHELTLRGQRGATGSASKLGSKSKSVAIGTAYELMGAAALNKKVSQPINKGAPPLHIQTGKDHVAFGVKSYLEGTSNDGVRWIPPTRSTIECDVRIGRKESDGFREIGIDFKHTKDMGKKYASNDLKNQVENVVEAITHGQLHEYHFVTNGKFGQSFCDVVNAANTELLNSGNEPIGLHEYVTTLASDPTAH